LKKFGESNDAKCSTKQLDRPQQKTGDRMKGCERLEGREQRRKLVTYISRRESYLSSLCIVFS